jgi:hypothetical protein
MGSEAKVDCTIGIDDTHLGDELTILPCKHWFHDECVVLWLKEHNTCPNCRAPIEKLVESSGLDIDGYGGSGGENDPANQQQRRTPGARLGLFHELVGANLWYHRPYQARRRLLVRSKAPMPEGLRTGGDA